MKKIITLSIIVFASLIFSGCSISNPFAGEKATMASATFIKSNDGGLTWEPKVKIDQAKTITGVNVLTMAMHPYDPSIIYIGTESSGLFVTKDAGETWQNVPFATKAYGLVFDPRDPNVMYGSGIFNGRAKIYKRVQEGEEWKEIYTEPSDGTIISTIAINRANPHILYAGTNEGVIIKTVDGGMTWVNLKKTTGPVISIGFDAANDAHVFFGVYQTGVLETRNGGILIEDISPQIDPRGNTTTIYTLTADPYYPGVVYVGTAAGLFRRTADGVWTPVNIIESSKSFPIRAVAVNPRNSKEIMYSSAKAIYKSTDGGLKWSTVQLETNKEISVIRYDASDPSKIYAGLRNF